MTDTEEVLLINSIGLNRQLKLKAIPTHALKVAFPNPAPIVSKNPSATIHFRSHAGGTHFKTHAFGVLQIRDDFK